MNVKRLYAAILDAIADSGAVEANTVRWLVGQYYPAAAKAYADIDFAIAQLIVSRRIVVNRANKLEVR